MKTSEIQYTPTSDPAGFLQISMTDWDESRLAQIFDQMRSLLMVLAVGPDRVRRHWPTDAARIADFESLASRYARADAIEDDGERDAARQELQAAVFTRLNILLYAAERAALAR